MISFCSTQLGAAVIEFSTEPRYDVENIIRDRAYSQAMAAKFLTMGKTLNPNNPVGDRTINSIYSNSNEELPT